ncbi:uncharacterized protein L201_007682 [Kwoniella dendrophila CBS 6074]|uniref:Uncharacterized protein n=1 Tax=Kwoniella dendrophila CBS 6074 TaxID=1295534 RepID=A0AAX4K6C5_9TREE
MAPPKRTDSLQEVEDRLHATSISELDDSASLQSTETKGKKDVKRRRPRVSPTPMRDLIKMQIGIYKSRTSLGSSSKWPTTTFVTIPVEDQALFDNHSLLEIVDLERVILDEEVAEDGTLVSTTMTAADKHFLVYKLKNAIDYSNIKGREEEMMEDNYLSNYIDGISAIAYTDEKKLEQSGYFPVTSCHTGRSYRRGSSRSRLKSPSFTPASDSDSGSGSCQPRIKPTQFVMQHQGGNPSTMASSASGHLSVWKDDPRVGSCYNMATVELRKNLFCKSCANSRRLEATERTRKCRAKHTPGSA